MVVPSGYYSLLSRQLSCRTACEPLLRSVVRTVAAGIDTAVDRQDHASHPCRIGQVKYGVGDVENPRQWNLDGVGSACRQHEQAHDMEEDRKLQEVHIRAEE